MYAKYKAVFSQKFSQSRAHKFVEEADADELCEMIEEKIKSSEVGKMLDDVLQGFSDQERSQNKKMKLIRIVFDALKKASVSTKHVDGIVSRIVIDFSSLGRSNLTKLVDYFVDRIRHNDDDFMCWKDVLPLLLEKLEEEKTINYRGSDVSGHEYKINIIRSICDINWDSSILTSVAKMFVEMIADIKDKGVCEGIMRALTSKIYNSNETVSLSELPPLVHQMLKLSAEHNSTLLFSTLSKYFKELYDSVDESSQTQESSDLIVTNKVSLKEVQETESTVLYYIYQSALDNAKGSMDYIRCLKSVVNAPEYILDNFVISVLLLLSGLYEDQALQILKAALLRQVQEEEHITNSAWLRKVLSDDVNAMKTINQVIENSNKDRQLVLKGMIDFAFVLLATERKLVVESYPPWDYGCKIIQKIVKKRHDVGGHVLEILVDKIVRNGSNVTQYTDCLAFMCRKSTSAILEHQAWITTLMEQLLVIPGNAATLVLRAILPLMRISGSIRENLIMILRKALYRKGTHTRQMAILGFLQLLKNLKLSTLTALSQSESLSSSNVGSSSSMFTQARMERPSQRNPWHNTSLCREILAILSKCFSHEAEVRSHLYQELYYGIVKNSELTEYVVEMLLEHFSNYYEKDESVLPPLLFDKCGSVQGIDVVLQEPLADLIFALQKIYLKVASNDSPRIDKLAVVLESLCKRMSQMDVEHLGIEDDTDLNDNTPKAQQKLLNIKMTISVYESLIAFRIASMSQDSVNTGQSIISLYKGHSRFVDYLKKLSKPKKGKGKKDKDKDKDGNDTTLKKAGRTTAIKMPNTVMDLDTVAKSLILLYDPSNSYSAESQSNPIKDRYEFHIYILQTCLQILQQIKVMKDYDLKIYLDLNKQNLFTIGRTLFKYFISDLPTIITFCEKIVIPGLECFKECCDIMCSFYSSELPAYLEAICRCESSQGQSQQLLGLITPLKDIFLLSLGQEATEDIAAQKIPLHLIETISKLIQKINFSEIPADKTFDWINEFAESHENIETPVAIFIVQLILLVEEKSQEYGGTIQDLCSEFGAIIGKVDKTEVTWTRKFNMLNEANLYVSYVAANKLLATKLQNVNWLLGKLNAELIASASLDADTESKRKKIKEKELSLCRQFSFIINTFEIMATVKITPGQASDNIFKNLQKVYNFASALAKYFKKKSSANNPAFQSVKFIPVVQGAGSALKQAIMELILHIESSQSGGKSNDTNVQRNKILKEVMVIPGVVQAMDMFDKEIALLAKKTSVDLMKYTKYDAIRDFRIKNTQFMENLEKMNVSLMITQTRNENANEDSTEQSRISDDSDSNSDSEETPAKKRRRN